MEHIIKNHVNDRKANFKSQFISINTMESCLHQMKTNFDYQIFQENGRFKRVKDFSFTIGYTKRKMLTKVVVILSKDYQLITAYPD